MPREFEEHGYFLSIGVKVPTEKYEFVLDRSVSSPVKATLPMENFWLPVGPDTASAEGTARVGWEKTARFPSYSGAKHDPGRSTGKDRYGHFWPQNQKCL